MFLRLGRTAGVLPLLRGGRMGRVLALVLLFPGIWACDDDPFKIRWSANPDTVLLYSLARPELNLNSGFDFVGRRAVRIEAPSAVGSLAPMGGMSFDEIRRAPRDTALYIGDRVVRVVPGELYVIRTRQQIGSWGTRCVYYGKLLPLEADPDNGTLTFVYDVSPVCNDRKLIPTQK
jgi:hypothetical protein